MDALLSQAAPHRRHDPPRLHLQRGEVSSAVDRDALGQDEVQPLDLLPAQHAEVRAVLFSHGRVCWRSRGVIYCLEMLGGELRRRIMRLTRDAAEVCPSSVCCRGEGHPRTQCWREESEGWQQSASAGAFCAPQVTPITTHTPTHTLTHSLTHPLTHTHTHTHTHTTHTHTHTHTQPNENTRLISPQLCAHTHT